MERVLSALIVVLAVSLYGVSGFPKLIHRSIDENVGITMNQMPQNESKAFQIHLHKLASNQNDELMTIARQILERVPLIDGYVHLIILRLKHKIT